MRFRVNRGELLQALSWAEAGLSTGDLVTQGKCFVFRGGWAVSFNDEVCVRARTPLPKEVTGAVRAKPLKAALEAFSDPEIDLTITDKAFGMGVHRTDVSVRMEKEILLPDDQVEAPDAWEPLPDEFSQAVEFVTGAAGTDDREFISVCVHLTPTHLEACDRIQYARWSLATGLPEDFLVRARSLAKIVPLGVDRVGITPNWVHFRNRQLVVSCRRAALQYPDAGRLVEFDAVPVTLPRGAISAANLASVFTGGDKEGDKVLVTLSDGHMMVAGEGTYGKSRVVLDTAYDYEPVSFRIPPKLLAHVVEEHSDCEISADRLRVRGENWVYVILLGAVESDEREPDESGSTVGGEPAGELVEAD